MQLDEECLERSGTVRGSLGRFGAAWVRFRSGYRVGCVCAGCTSGHWKRHGSVTESATTEAHARGVRANRAARTRLRQAAHTLSLTPGVMNTPMRTSEIKNRVAHRHDSACAHNSSAGSS